jgi:hypothetical protein
MVCEAGERVFACISSSSSTRASRKLQDDLGDIDRLGHLEGDMRPLLGRPFKCSGCGSRDVSLWLFAKRDEADAWSEKSGPGF